MFNNKKVSDLWLAPVAVVILIALGLTPMLERKVLQADMKAMEQRLTVEIRAANPNGFCCPIQKVGDK